MKATMTFWLRILLICCISTAIPLTCAAGIYKYRDANGRLNFVDDESKIPAQFRDNVTSIGAAKDSIIVYDHKDVEKAPKQPAATLEEAERRAERKLLQKYRTPVTIDGNRVLVPVTLAMGNRSVKLSLLLDTGATRTVFHRQSLAGLVLPSGKSYKAQVAGGGIVSSRKIKFRKLTVGPFEITKASAMVINLETSRKVPFDGMLGMDFLKSHPYQIDFQNEMITWEIPD